MYLGDKTLKTGVWRHDFMYLIPEYYITEHVYADGVEMTVIRLENADANIQNGLTQVASGTAVLLVNSGILLFHSADAGKVITTNALDYMHTANPDPNP
jgi:hypothetical protein